MMLGGMLGENADIVFEAYRREPRRFTRLHSSS
jgi:hypothetical protein